MNNKVTHGKVCRSITLEETKTPVATKGEGTTMESTITLSFHTGAVHLEEIVSVEAAKDLYNKLSKIFES